MKTVMSVMIASLLSLASFTCNEQKVDNSTVKSLDLNRYLGTWYEIARFDHSFERGLTHAKAHYSLNENGTLTVTNSGLKDGKHKVSMGKAKLTSTAGRLRVSFFGPFYSDYRVLMVSDDYNYALVGSSGAKHLWILSRFPEIPGGILKQIVSVAAGRGYDTRNLIWVEQTTY